MLVSALVTSLGINSGLCVLFFTLYSVLRKQPSNYDVYIPRLVAEGKYKLASHFELERLLPSPGWVRKAWNLTEDELLASSGLDALVFQRLILFSLKVFALAGIIGIFVLLPLNCLGDQLEDIDFTDFSNNSLDVFTISNVKNGSKWLWFHFASVYAVTIWTCCLLYYEYSYISAKRIAYFYSSKSQPHQFTILVRGIPVPEGSSISDSVDRFFTEFYPATYLSHMVVRRTNKLRGLVDETKKLYKRITQLQSDPNQQRVGCCSCLGLFRRKSDVVDQCEKKLEDMEQNVRMQQSEVASSEEETRAAFVSFKSRYAAASIFHMPQSINPTEWVTERAPEPSDVYWPFFSSSFLKRWIYKIVVIVACILLTILFLIPVVLVQGLTNLNQLELLFPFLKSILEITFVSSVITGYLPSLILQLFLKAVPPIMEFLSSIQGYIAHSEIIKSACNKVLWFTIWNVFFATVFSGSALYQVSIFLDPKSIPSRLAIAVPAQASFFIAYVVTSGWTSTASELFRVIPFICSWLKSPCGGQTEEQDVPTIPYHRDIPRILFFGLLGIAYFFLAPLILPFLLIYFCLAFIIFRNQFINVYGSNNETGGRFWPNAHTSVIFSLVLMHCIAIGIFTLKKLSIASTLIFPLPVLTLLFNEYCRKRFLPVFSSYSGESLIKKDRQDEHDPAMPEFFNKLVIAYQDPTLMPIQYPSLGGQTQTTPPLSLQIREFDWSG